MIMLNKIVLVFTIILATSVALTLLIAGSRRRTANALFGFHFLIIAIQMTGHLFSYSLFDVARYSQYNSALVLLLPPLLYLYIRVLLSEKKWKFPPSQSIHFIPSLIGVIIGLNGLVLPSEHRVLLYISGTVYGLAICSQIQTKSRNWNISNHKTKMVSNWVKTLTCLFGIALVADATLFFGFRYFADSLLLIETAVLFTVLGYTIFPVSKLLQASHRRGIFRLLDFPQQTISNKTSGSSSPSDPGMVLKLQNHLDSQKIYMNPDLTLSDVSEAMNLTTRELSELINGNLGTNFVSFVNSYRIKMAKQLLVDPNDTNLTISEIMYEVGFNSRSSFNTLFKKETGMTPSEFRERYIDRSHQPKPIIQQSR